MIPEWWLQVSLFVVSILGASLAYYYLNQKQYHHALWAGYLAVIVFLFVVVMYIRNDLILKEIAAAQTPNIGVGIFPLVDQEISSTQYTIHKYPFDEYTLLISNRNKDSLAVSNLTVEFFFKNIVVKAEGTPILDSGGPVTVGQLQMIKGEGHQSDVVEDQPLETPVAKLMSIQVRQRKTDGKSVNTNIAIFNCEKWPKGVAFEGSIVIDMTKEPTLITKPGLMGTYTGKYYYDIQGKGFSKEITGSIPDPNIQVKLAEHHYFRGNDFEQEDDYDQAIPEYSKAIELYPEYADAYFKRGYAFLQKQKCNKAISDCNRVIELKPMYAHAYFNRASAYATLKRYDEAITDFATYINMRPKDPEGYYYRGLAQARKGQHQKARTDYKKACDLGMKKACEEYHKVKAK